MGSITTLYLHQFMFLGKVGRAKQALFCKRTTKKRNISKDTQAKSITLSTEMDYFHSLLLVDGVNFIHQPEQK